MLEEVLQVRGLDVDFLPTKRGVRIRLPLQPISQDSKMHIAFLACGGSDKSTILSILLRHLSDNFYARMCCWDPANPEVLEIPTAQIEPSGIKVVDLICVDDPVSYETNQPAKTTNALFEIKSICDLFWGRGLNTGVYDKAWNTICNPQESQNLANDPFLHTLIPWPATRQFFLVASNDSDESELILVFTQEVSDADNMTALRVGVRAVTFEPNEDIPANMRTRPAKDIYKSWCETHDLSNMSTRTAARLSDGLCVKFLLVRDRNLDASSKFFVDVEGSANACYTLWSWFDDSGGYPSVSTSGILTQSSVDRGNRSTESHNSEVDCVRSWQ